MPDILYRWKLVLIELVGFSGCVVLHKEGWRPWVEIA